MQLSFPEVPPPRPLPTRCDEISAEAHAWIVAHPDMWTLFCEITEAQIRNGERRGSSKQVWEEMRRLRKKRPTLGQWALDNNYTADMARAFAREHPEHADFFRTRSRISEHRKARDLQSFDRLRGAA